jgi:hypothetical protein
MSFSAHVVTGSRESLTRPIAPISPLPRHDWLTFQSQSYVTLRPTVSQPISLGIKHLSGAQDEMLLLSVAGLLMWDALFDERTDMSFTIAACPRQLSHSRVRVLRDS